MTDETSWCVVDLLPLFAVAQVVLLGLKLTRVLTCSWWWVLAPLWGFPALVLLLGAALALSLWWHDRRL